LASQPSPPSWPLLKCMEQLHYRYLFWSETQLAWRFSWAKMLSSNIFNTLSRLEIVKSSSDAFAMPSPKCHKFSEIITDFWPYLSPGWICSGFLDLWPFSMNISDGIHDGINHQKSQCTKPGSGFSTALNIALNVCFRYSFVQVDTNTWAISCIRDEASGGRNHLDETSGVEDGWPQPTAMPHTQHSASWSGKQLLSIHLSRTSSPLCHPCPKTTSSTQTD